MSFYIEYIHIWSANIVLLLFILSAIGHILQDNDKNSPLSKKLIQYYNIILLILVLTGCIMLISNQFWISFPIFKYKLILVTLLISLSIIYYLYQNKSKKINPIFLILSFLAVYSISMIIGRYTNG